eukprot:scaffold40261_cov197-Isochrysis_galbana.AAC.2
MRKAMWARSRQTGSSRARCSSGLALSICDAQAPCRTRIAPSRRAWSGRPPAATAGRAPAAAGRDGATQHRLTGHDRPLAAPA